MEFYYNMEFELDKQIQKSTFPAPDQKLISRKHITGKKNSSSPFLGSSKKVRKSLIISYFELLKKRIFFDFAQITVIWSKL